MRPSQIITCAVPPLLWQSSPRAPGGLDVLQDLTREVLSSERRLAKRVNEDAERERYEDCCDLLEHAVLQRATPYDPTAAPDETAFPSVASRGDYIALLLKLGQARRSQMAGFEARLGRSFIPPREVREHLTRFERYVKTTDWADSPELACRADFLREFVLPRGWGVVEGHLLETGIRPDWRPRPASDAADRRVSRAAEQLGDSSTPLDVEESFRWRVGRALEGCGSVNMNNQNHVVISRVLADFLLGAKDVSPAAIRVVYADGSEAEPFPLRCLRPADRETPEQILPVALMSMRHLFLDERVVVNWLRNREIDQSSSLARSDYFCYRHSLRQLEVLRSRTQAGWTRQRNRLRIDLYHTGYEPAVVGFYRAVVETIRDGGDWLRVIPHYYTDQGTFDQGPSWPPLERE